MQARGNALDSRYGGAGGCMTPWCIVLVCRWRRSLADRHSLPFPWTLYLHRRRCPSACHHPVPFLFLLRLSCPLYFPFLSLGKLCQRSPRTFPVLLLRIVSTQEQGIPAGKISGGENFNTPKSGCLVYSCGNHSPWDTADTPNNLWGHTLGTQNQSLGYTGYTRIVFWDAHSHND